MEQKYIENISRATLERYDHAFRAFAGPARAEQRLRPESHNSATLDDPLKTRQRNYSGQGLSADRQVAACQVPPTADTGSRQGDCSGPGRHHGVTPLITLILAVIDGGSFWIVLFWIVLLKPVRPPQQPKWRLLCSYPRRLRGIWAPYIPILTTAQVRRLPGFGTRAEVDYFLMKAHGVFLRAMAADIERDAFEASSTARMSRAALCACRAFSTSCRAVSSRAWSPPPESIRR